MGEQARRKIGALVRAMAALSTRLGQSPQQTAEAVAASAVRRSGARQDDITVAIVRLERQKS